jgi:hypothetical protein
VTTDLVCLPQDRCPDCDGIRLRRREAEQFTLFRHGGYGAWQRTVWRYCPDCGWTLTEVVESTRPTTWSAHTVVAPLGRRIDTLRGV